MSFVLLGILNSQAAGGGAGTPAFDHLQSIAVSGTPTSVTFTGLSAYTDYTHLQFRGTVRAGAPTSSTNLNMRFNGISASQYFNHRIGLNGSAGFVQSLNNMSANAGKIAMIPGNAEITNGYGGFVADILDFGFVGKAKTVRTMSGFAGNNAPETVFNAMYVFLTDAIDSITLLPDYDDFANLTRFDLYGIKGE